jgi:hypothetical protein
VSGFLLGVTGLIYVGVSVSQWLAGNRGMSMAFAGYAFANLGFILGGVR